MGLLERERQLQLKAKSLQSCLKNEKEEVFLLSAATDSVRPIWLSWSGIWVSGERAPILLEVTVSFIHNPLGSKASEHYCKPGQPVQSRDEKEGKRI